MCFAKIVLHQTSLCTGLDKVLKKYHPKCSSVRNAVTYKSVSKTLQSESILKLARILCFWLMVSTQEKSKKHSFTTFILTSVTDRQTQRHGQTSLTDKSRF